MTYFLKISCVNICFYFDFIIKSHVMHGLRRFFYFQKVTFILELWYKYLEIILIFIPTFQSMCTINFFLSSVIISLSLNRILIFNSANSKISLLLSMNLSNLSLFRQERSLRLITFSLFYFIAYRSSECNLIKVGLRCKKKKINSESCIDLFLHLNTTWYLKVVSMLLSSLGATLRKTSLGLF